MKRFCGYGLVLLVVLGFCVSQVLARGGHGGGHHSGHHGHHGNHHHANHHASHHAHHHSHWAHHNRPFSRGWYGGHRGAWGGGYGWGNPWHVANWGTTAAWLGMGAAAPAFGGYGPTNTTIYASDNVRPNAPAESLSPEALASESAAAQGLAAKGTAEPGKDEKFLPLGVFTLAPENQTEATAMLQMAVSKQGVLRGTYYDLLSDVDHPIRGSVDKKTQHVAWTVGPQGKVTFQTALGVLTEPSGPVSVHYENGQTRQWVLARYDKEPTEEDDESGTDDDDDDADDDKAGK